MSDKSYKEICEEGKYSANADKIDISYNEIGKRGVKRIDGYVKASGKAMYTSDVQIAGMLYGRIMMSPYAHAKIMKMDTSKAEKVPGVRNIIRYDDSEIKGKLLNGSYFGPDWVCPKWSGFALKPEHLVLGDEAWYEGQPVGVAVFANSEDIAKKALNLVEIEWKELKFVLDEEDAIKPDAPILRPNAKDNLVEYFEPVFKKGDIEKGFKEADKIIEFETKRNAHQWVVAELPSVTVKWNGDILEMWVYEQQPYHEKMLIAEALNIPMSKISVHTLYQGGSYGGRGNPANNSENGMNVLGAIAAKRTNRPVKVLYNREEAFFGESGDIMKGYVKVGAKNDGTITSVYMKNIFAVYVCTPGWEHFVENTKIPNIYGEVYQVDVSKGPAWWARCEQLPNCLIFTLVFDRVAAELGLDPTEVAIKNDGCDGHDISFLKEYERKHGFKERDSLKECVEIGKKAIGWDEKWHVPNTKKLSNGRMHGIAFTWNHNWDDHRGTGSAAVMIESDGTVSIIGQHSDLGVNPWSSYCQIVADEIGVNYEDVNIKPFDVDHGFNLMSPDGSANLCANGFIVKKAARKAKKMLLELAEKKFEGFTAKDLEVKDKFIYVKNEPEKKITIKEIVKKAMPMHDSCVFWTTAPIIAWAWHTQGLFGQALRTGRPRLARQAHFIEVEVDTETGQIEIIKIVNVNDVGKAISPETVEGQMYGGTYMGVGRAIFEEMIWDKRTGVLLNRNLLDYKIPTILDCGPIETKIVETGLGHGPYGATGVGESTPTVIPALLSPAVYNAIGKWVNDFPITPDKILKALGKAKGEE